MPQEEGISINRHLTPTDFKKVGATLSLLLALGIGGVVAWQKARHNQEELASFRTMALEMGKGNEGEVTSRPEEDSQKLDPHFQP